MDNSIQIGDRLLVVFDGNCGLCNGAVRWLLRRDRKDRLRFVAMDSSKLLGLRARHSLASIDSKSGTVLVVRDVGGAEEELRMRSDAVVALLQELPWPWRTVGKALELIPRPVRDLGYRLIARWRYRIWGRLESCPLPTAEERARFL